MAVVSHAQVSFAKFAKKIQLDITVLNANQDIILITMNANHVLTDAIHAEDLEKIDVLHAKMGIIFHQILKVNTNVKHVMIFVKSVMGQVSKNEKNAKMDNSSSIINACHAILPVQHVQEMQIPVHHAMMIHT